jgi:hypothetical protein
VKIKTAFLLIASALVALGDSLAPEIVYRLDRIYENDNSYLSTVFMPKRFGASAVLHELSKGPETAYFGTIERPYHDSLGPLTNSHALFVHTRDHNTAFGIRPRIDFTLDYFRSFESADGLRIGQDGIRNYYWSRTRNQWRRHTELRYSGLLFGRYASSDLKMTAIFEGGLEHHFGYAIEESTKLNRQANQITYYVTDYEPEDFSTSLLAGLTFERRLRIWNRDFFVFLGGTISSSEDMTPSIARGSKKRNDLNHNDFGIVYTSFKSFGREKLLWTGFRAPPARWGKKKIFLWGKKVLGLSLEEFGIRLFQTKLEKELYELRYPPNLQRGTLDTIPHRIETSGVLFRVVPELHVTKFASLSVPFSAMEESRTLYPTAHLDTRAEIVRREIALEARIEIPVAEFLGTELRVFSGPLVIDNPDRYYTDYERSRGKSYFYRFSEASVSLSLVSRN